MQHTRMPRVRICVEQVGNKQPNPPTKGEAWRRYGKVTGRTKPVRLNADIIFQFGRESYDTEITEGSRH